MDEQKKLLYDLVKKHRNIFWALSALLLSLSAITMRLGCQADEALLRLDHGKLDQQKLGD